MRHAPCWCEARGARELRGGDLGKDRGAHTGVRRGEEENGVGNDRGDFVIGRESVREREKRGQRERETADRGREVDLTALK